MEFLMDMGIILFPIVLVGSLSLFIIFRLYKQYKKGKILIRGFFVPYGMLVGAIIGILISLFARESLVYIVTLSSGIGMLIGYFVEEKVSETEKNNN